MAIPSSPGSYVGEHQNGYFWNGTSWEPGPTAAPSTAFGGTIINQQNAKPAPTPAASAAAKRASILATIMRNESGGRNIPQNIDDINMRRGTPAQGYFQIINPTWSEFGGDKTSHKSAIDAPYATQLQIAQNIPVQRWGPATQQALKAAGYEPQPGETLGQMLARYGEDPNATRPEDVGGSSSGGTAVAAASTAAPGGDYQTIVAGLLAKQQEQAASTEKAAALAEEAKQMQAMQSVTKQGLGLLGEAETAPPPMALQPAPMQRAQAQAPGNPDFIQMLAQQRLMRRA